MAKNVGIVFRKDVKGWIRELSKNIAARSNKKIYKISFRDNNKYPVLKSTLTTSLDLEKIIDQKIEEEDLDIIHILSDNYCIGFNPKNVKKPIITSVHSLQEDLGFRSRVINNIKKRSYGKSNYLIANSLYTKEKIRNLNSEIGVVPPCIDTTHYTPSESPEEIDAPYFFHISNGEKRENIKFLINIFSGIDNNSKLVIGGQLGEREDELRNFAERTGAKEKIIFTGWIAENDLPKFYSGAEAYLHPSENESFGIPSIEAMACGTYPITSDRGALPEVVGEFGSTISLEKELWKKEISTVLSSDKNIEKLTSRAHNFSWEVNIHKIDEIYEALGKKNS